MRERLVLESAAARLDRFLVEQYPAVPRSRWEGWIRQGQVLVDGEAVTKPGARLRSGATVETDLPEVTPPGASLVAQDLDVPTLFEDERLWIVDKPAGMVAHPGPGHPDGTLVNALVGRMKAALEVVDPHEGDEEEEEYPAPIWPGLVHRLDRFTTGCLAMAKDAQAQTLLQRQFKDRTVEKIYLALVRNSRRLPDCGSLLVDQPLARHRTERTKMTITSHGRPSQTRVKVLARSGGVALVSCELLTGRTHQIRLHLNHLGAPILGDPLYGGPTQWLDLEKRPIPFEHPLLHAWQLALDHPGTGDRLRVSAPLPEAFRAVMGRLDLPIPPGA